MMKPPKAIVYLFTIGVLIMGIYTNGYAQNKISDGQVRESYAKSADVYTKAEVNSTVENAIAAIPAASVNQTITVTAGEALTAGQVVSLINESGTMKAYNQALSVNISPNGAENVFNAAATSYCNAVALDTTRFIVVFQDADSSKKKFLYLRIVKEKMFVLL